MKFQETSIDKVYCPILRLYKINNELIEEQEVEEMFATECVGCSLNREKSIAQMIAETAALYAFIKEISNPKQAYQKIKEFAERSFLNSLRN